jgi:hypothetical protein
MAGEGIGKAINVRGDGIKFLLVSLVAVHAGDAITTHVGLASGRAQEVIMTQQGVMNDAIIGAELLAESAGLTWLVRQGHPKAARILGWTIVGLRGSVVAWNTRQLARR